MGFLWHMWQERNDADAQYMYCDGLDAGVLENNAGGEIFRLVGKHMGSATALFCIASK